jgi:cytidylate kinase
MNALPEMAIAFSGLPGSGRSELSKAYATDMGWPLVRFGDTVRRAAALAGMGDDIKTLQRLGQSMVVTDPRKFLLDTLAGADGARHVVFDGLRHVEVLYWMQQLLHRSRIRLVHLEVDVVTRADRLKARGICQREMAAIESHLVEAQLGRILRQHADKTLDGFLPTRMLVALVETAFPEAPTANSLERDQ